MQCVKRKTNKVKEQSPVILASHEEEGQTRRKKKREAFNLQKGCTCYTNRGPMYRPQRPHGADLITYGKWSSRDPILSSASHRHLKIK